MEISNFNEYDRFPADFWYIFARNDLLKKLSKRHIKRYSQQGRLKILDLGCGTGFNYPVLNTVGDVYNVDIDKRALESCKKKGLPRLKRADAQDLPFKDSFFDVVVAIEILEHVPSDRKAIEEIHRVLKNGGLFVFTVPAHRFLWSSDDVLAHHKRRYSKKKLGHNLGRLFRRRYFGYRYFFLFIPSVFVFMTQKLIKRRRKKDVNSLTMTPRFMNRVLRWVMSVENWLISHDIPLLIGVGLVGVFKKIDKR